MPRLNRTAGLDWYGLTKKYFWDDDSTPYLTPVVRLNQHQAHKELVAFAVLFSAFWGTIALAAALALARDAGWPVSIQGVYALTLVAAAVALAVGKSRLSAYVCLTAPAALALYFAVVGFHPKLGLFDKIVLLGFLALWLRYSLRVLAIVNAYSTLTKTTKA